MTEVPDWAQSPPPATGGVHGTPAQLAAWNAPSQNQLQDMRGKLVESILQIVVQALTGLFLPGGLGAAFTQLQAWAAGLADQLADLPIIGPYIEFLFSLFGVDIGEPGFDINDLSLFTLWNSVVNAFLSPLNVFAQLINGIIPQWLIGPIHIGRITADLPDLVFDTALDVPPVAVAGEWYHRADVGHSSPGSAWIDADGDEHELIGQNIAVAVGQTYQPAVWAAWNSATGTSGSFQLIVVEFNTNAFRTGTTVVVSTAPSGTSAFTQITGPYTVPAGVAMVSLGVRVTAGFTAGSLGVDDLTGPPTGQLQKDWTQFLTQNIENVAMLFGVADTDLDGDIDFDDVWNTVHANVPPIVNIAVDAVGTTLQSLLDGLASAFDPLIRALGGLAGQTAPDLIAAAIVIADKAEAALATSITTANAAGDAQANEDDGVEIVDLNVFAGVEGAALNPADWVSSQTGGVDDVVVRVLGTPMMGIRYGGTPQLLEPLTNQYYTADWVNTFSTTTGFGQLVEIVLGPDGRYADTIALLHSTATFTEGSYLKINGGGMEFGTYTRSGAAYAFTPIGTPLVTGLSAGMRVGMYNDPNVANVYNLTVNGRVAKQITDTGPTVDLDATHVSARILLERNLVVWNAGWPWGTAAYMDSFAPAQVLYADYDPPTTVGTYFRAYRTSATGVTPSSTGEVDQFPNSWYDVVDRRSNDLTFTSASANQLTVSKSGAYIVKICQALAAGVFGAHGFKPLLYVNRAGGGWTQEQAGQHTTYDGAAETRTFADTFIVYLDAGDMIRPGFFYATTGAAAIFRGDTTGAYTYFEVAKGV